MPNAKSHDAALRAHMTAAEAITPARWARRPRRHTQKTRDELPSALPHRRQSCEFAAVREHRSTRTLPPPIHSLELPLQPYLSPGSTPAPAPTPAPDTTS